MMQTYMLVERLTQKSHSAKHSFHNILKQKQTKQKNEKHAHMRNNT